MNERNDKGPPAQRLAAAFQLALSTLAFGVPILYVMGRVYAEGYWSGLHLPPSMMEHGVEDYLYLGFVGLFNAGARLFAVLGLGALRYILAAAGVLIVLATYVVALDKWFVPTIKRLSRNIDTKLTHWEGDRRGWWATISKLAMALWFGAAAICLFLLVAFFVAVLPVLLMHNAGTTQADQVRKRLSAAGTDPNKDRAIPVLRYRDDTGALKAALLVECSAQWCFVFESGAFSAVPSQGVARIDHCRWGLDLRSGSPACAVDPRKASLPSSKRARP